MKNLITTLTVLEIACYLMAFIGVLIDSLRETAKGVGDAQMNLLALVAIGIVIVKTLEIYKLENRK